MRIGELAHRVGTTAHSIRFYERRGLLPAPERSLARYREYSEGDVSRLRLLIGLRSLDLPLDQAAELASLCADGRCDQVSDELRVAIKQKRREIARRADELRYLDHRLAHLAGELEAGRSPRPLITAGKEERDAS
ncbi:MAG: MerR family transcriptional regulator [Chloroflexota bacterium]|nr:MerR family transcriptional regulator [Chloroflexota bacterium]